MENSFLFSTKFPIFMDYFYSVGKNKEKMLLRKY